MSSFDQFVSKLPAYAAQVKGRFDANGGEDFAPGYKNLDGKHLARWLGGVDEESMGG